MNASWTEEQAAAELLRRERARSSLVDFARSVEIPGVPVSSDEAVTDWLFKPIESSLARHHVVILEAAQWAVETGGYVMIFAPPGSAKSTFAAVVTPAWVMGRWPGTPVMMVSYASHLARKHSRRTRALVRSAVYRGVFAATLPNDQRAVDDWALSNTSSMMASGILSGNTGNRSGLLVIDDPVAGRQAADSPDIQDQTWGVFASDLMTRRKPGTAVILIQTRWSEGDLAGRLLPDSYAGESGMVACRDGNTWKVINIPAVCERLDDPVGRQIGEPLWPEWFDAKEFDRLQNASDPDLQRTWSALYQQRPRPPEGIEFRRDDFVWVKEPPTDMQIVGASDYATTEGGGNFTDHGVFGMGLDGKLYALDWWHGQRSTDVSIGAFIDLVKQWKPRLWFGERGTIEASIGPEIDRRMLEAQAFVTRQLLPTTGQGNKSVRLAAFRARQKAGAVCWPKDTPWAARVVDQLMGFPAGRFNDACDVCGLIGRGVMFLRSPERQGLEVIQGGRSLIQEALAVMDERDDYLTRKRRANLGCPIGNRYG